MKDYNEQIETILAALKQYYIERNKDNIANLSNLLFKKESQPIIIGTSNDEWCFGLKKSEELFLSDWEGWGNVSIEVENAVFETSDTYSWFYVPAGIEYVFEDNEETYAAFMDSAIEIAASQKAPLSKAGEIVWLLSHLLHNRPLGRRKYVWDMTISGILENVESSLKIKTMQFSLPVLSAYSDVRTDISQDDELQYKNECEKIFNYNAQHKNDNDAKYVEILTQLYKNDENISFVHDSVYRYIGTDGVKRNALEQIDYLNGLREKGITVKFPKENIIFSKNNNSFYFCGVGIFERALSLDSELNAVFSNMEHYGDSKDKQEALYRLRRDLTQVMKESAIPSQSLEPFRIEGTGKISEAKKMIIEYMQISFPFNCILEQKTDAVM